MTLVEFLKYGMTSTGISIILGFIISLVIEWYPEYEGLASRWKRIGMMVICFAVPLLCMLGLVVVGDLTLSVNTIWLALSAGFAAYFGSQVAHAGKLSMTSQGSSIDEDVRTLFGPQ